jgi:hypothetical protein
VVEGLVINNGPKIREQSHANSMETLADRGYYPHRFPTVDSKQSDISQHICQCTYKRNIAIEKK